MNSNSNFILNTKNPLDPNKVIVAMSGGVDSSVVAILLKQKGYDVIGVTMKTWGNRQDSTGAPKKINACCSLDAIFDCKSVAKQFGFQHFVADFSDRFEELIIDNFVDEYLQGRTPNPCVLCNRKIKWEELLIEADKYGAKYIATGHYAQIGFSEIEQRFFLKNAIDSSKDQTYALWGLTQQSLSRTILPLGEFKKEEVRKIAEKFNLSVAKKPDSMEICFVNDNNYERFIRERVPEKVTKVTAGKIFYNGEIVGKHKGIPFYTVGQRKGIGVTYPHPVFVKKIDAENNSIEIGDKEALYSKSVKISKLNFMSVNKLEIGEKIFAKIRYSDIVAPAIVTSVRTDFLKIDFAEPKFAITPGQSAVIYNEFGLLLVGGIITN